MLSIDEVKHVADLARLNLTDKELELYSQQLSAIVSYVEQLNEVEVDQTSGLDLSDQTTLQELRTDEVVEWNEEEKELALKQSVLEDHQVKVNRVLN